MPFAHCIDCGTSALIDPSGRCPEGHKVGTAGTRVAAAIGSSGPHPDEPTPWVGVVDLDPTIVDAAPPEPRVARPLSLPASDQDVTAEQTPTATDDLLRELHALGDLGDLGDVGDLGGRPSPPATPPAQPRPAPAPSTTPPVAAPPAPTPTPIQPPRPVAVTPGSPAPPSSPEEATDLDELASLAAAIGSLDDREAVPGRAQHRDVTPAEPAPLAVPAPPPTSTAPPVPTAAVPGAVAIATPFDGSFTARGDGVGRRTQRRLDAKATKKGLFRR